MSEVTERYAVVAQGFEQRENDVGAEQWSAPSPCADWTARDVVVHVIETHRHVLATLDGQEAASAVAGEDLAQAWRTARSGIEAALADPARSGQTISGMFGEQPFESLVGRLLCADTLVHTWDLARATGQDEALDPDAVAKAAEFLSPLDDAIRRPGGFAPEIGPSPGDEDQARFLKFCGRAGSAPHTLIPGRSDRPGANHSGVIVTAS